MTSLASKTHFKSRTMARQELSESPHQMSPAIVRELKRIPSYQVPEFPGNFTVVDWEFW